MNFTEDEYEKMMEELFRRFPSFQKSGADAYKPGIANMEFFDQLAGHPHRNYRIIHVAGTNGKGSVSNMLASALAATGLKVGLYTSPHILDFRERMRVVEAVRGAADDVIAGNAAPLQSQVQYVPKEYVWYFIRQWQDTFDHLDMSFFEITTVMAFSWFAEQKVDIVVLETGLGGRLDSTNIVSPELCVITNIGLDHCDMLGDTLPEIAFEKAGIIKPKVPVVIGESHPETDPVFERKVLYTNLPEPDYMGNSQAIMSLLTFADKVEPSMWNESEEILAEMDLQGVYQRKNLRTVLAALDVLRDTACTSAGKLHAVPQNSGVSRALSQENCSRCIRDAIIQTASRMDFHGRWEKLSDSPYTICDIGHNGHGLKYNFAQLAHMQADGYSLIMVYGSVADKDVDAVLHLMPEGAQYVFTQAHGKRALAAETIRERYMSYCEETGRAVGNINCSGTVVAALKLAYSLAAQLAETGAKPLVYIGGSTYVVSEAVAMLKGK